MIRAALLGLMWVPSFAVAQSAEPTTPGPVFADAPADSEAEPTPTATPTATPTPTPTASPDPNATATATPDPNAERRGHPMAPRARFIGAYRLGFAGGSVEYSVTGPFGTTSSVDDTLLRSQGLTLLRIDGPIGDFFALGGALRGSLVNGERANSTGEEAMSVFDLGLVPRARYTFDFGVVGLEPSLSVPVGFTVGVFDKDFSGQPGFGWHVGVLAGLQLLLGGHFGILVEMGWLQQRLNVDARSGPAVVTLRQALLQTGLVVAFGRDSI